MSINRIPECNKYAFISGIKGTTKRFDHKLNEKAISINIKKSTAYISHSLGNHIRNQP